MGAAEAMQALGSGVPEFKFCLCPSPTRTRTLVGYAPALSPRLSHVCSVRGPLGAIVRINENISGNLLQTLNCYGLIRRWQKKKNRNNLGTESGNNEI